MENGKLVSFQDKKKLTFNGVSEEEPDKEFSNSIVRPGAGEHFIAASYEPLSSANPG